MREYLQELWGEDESRVDESSVEGENVATYWGNFGSDPAGCAEGLWIRETCEVQRFGTVSGICSLHK